MEPVVSVKGLQKRYGATVAVRDVSFDVYDREIFGIIGPNGSGKTTTVECLQGLRVPDAGELSIHGLVPGRDQAQLRQIVGSQLQESALPDRIKVWEALDLFASFVPGARDWRPLLDEWGLAEKRDAVFASLSGGQRQRLFVALALVNSPSVVFLDEMTTGLDPAARREAWDLVRAIRDRGATVILITHFMDEAEYLCDRIAVFRRGEIVTMGSPASIVQGARPDLTVRFTAELDDHEWLWEVPGVREVRRNGTGFEVTGTGALLAHTAAALVVRGYAPEDLRVERASLEDAYLRLTSEGASEVHAEADGR